MNEKHNFNLKNFEGPLDLLLHLVQRKQIDVMSINVLEIANQYLEFIKEVQNNDLEVAGEYMVMATSLLFLKSKMLIADPRDLKSLEKEKEKLLSELVEYQRIKIIMKNLQQRETKRLKIYNKDPEDLAQFEIETDTSKLDGHSSMISLISAIRRLLDRTYSTIIGNKVITYEKIPLEIIVEKIRDLFNHKMQLSFDDVFKTKDLRHCAITLLAVLDMAKNQELIISQKKDFGEMSFRVRKEG